MDPHLSLSVASVLCVVAALLQIAAYVTPMWIWNHKDTSYSGNGLWYIYVKTAGNEGTVSTYTAGSFGDKEWQFNVLRGMQTSSVIGAVLSCMFVFGLRSLWAKADKIQGARLGSILIIGVTCVCILVGCGFLVGYFNDTLKVIYETSDGDSIPWSLVMSLVSFLILIFVVILLLFSKDRDPLDKIPISGDSKMYLTPTVTNAQNNRRYFVPSPYSDDRRSANFSDGSPSRYDDKPLFNGVSKKEYLPDEYNPFYHRPRSYAEPNTRQSFGPSYLPPKNDFDQRQFHSLDRRTQPSVYAMDNPVYQGKRRYEDVTDPVPPAPKALIPPPEGRGIVMDPRFTTEFRDGQSTSYIYRPYAPRRY